MSKVRVQFNFPEKLVKDVDKMAEEMGQNRTSVIVWILSNYFVNRQQMMEKFMSNETLMDQMKEILTQIKSVDVGESER